MSSSRQSSQGKRANSALTKQNTSEAIHQFESMKFAKYCDDNIRSDLGRNDFMPGINHPCDAGITCHSSAILDTGANQTYVNDRRLISNLHSETASVEVADGSKHPILASGPLVSHPHIHANYVPSFSNNLIGISPIIHRGAVGII